MRHLKLILLGVIMLTYSGVYSQAQTDSVFTLQQCVDIAIKNNLDVKKSELQLEADRINHLQAKENMLPTINGDVGHTFSNGRALDLSNTYTNQSQISANYGLTGGLTLFNGLQTLNSIKQASLAYQAGKMDLQQAKDQVTINVITAYLQVLDNTELLTQAQNQIGVSKKQVERLEILEKEGANKVPSDLSDLKGNYNGSQLSLVNAANALESSKLNLIQILNVPYKKGFMLSPLNAQDVATQTNQTSDQVYSTALAQLAYVKAASLRRQSAEKAVSVAKGALLPSISLGGGINTAYSSTGQTSVKTGSVIDSTGAFVNTPSGRFPVMAEKDIYMNKDISYYNQFKNNYGTYFSIGLHIPILSGFTSRNRVALAKIDLLETKYVEENTKIQLRQNVEQAYLNMVSAYNRYNVLVEQVRAYAESFRISEIRFNAGVLTSVDYVLAKNNLDVSNINLINARYDCYIYNKILDYYQGKLAF